MVAGIAGAGAAGLVFGDGLGRAAAGGRLAARAGRELRVAATGVTVDRVRASAVRYRRFPLIGSWSTLINSIGFEAPLLLVVAFYGSSVGGLFAFAQRLIGAPVALVVLAVGQVFMAEAAVRSRDATGDLEELFRTTVKRLALVAAPLMLSIAVAATLLVGPVFGSEWEEAGTYITILTPLYTMQLLTSPLAGTLSILERQDLALVREIVRILLLTIAIVIAQELSLSPTWAVAPPECGGQLRVRALRSDLLARTPRRRATPQARARADRRTAVSTPPDTPARTPPLKPRAYYTAVGLMEKVTTTRRLRSPVGPQQGVRILCYHRISSERDVLAVHPDAFRRQLEAIRATGARVLRLDRAIDLLEQPVDDFCVCITFDDGYRDALEVAAPILSEFGMPGTVYLPTAMIDGDAPYDWVRGAPGSCGARLGRSAGADRRRPHRRAAAHAHAPAADCAGRRGGPMGARRPRRPTSSSGSASRSRASRTRPVSTARATPGSRASSAIARP